MKVDWTDVAKVIEYARSLGPGLSVIKYPGRANYNIAHTENLFRPGMGGVKVIYQT